ncbi:MAG: DUF1573 domain-containing protein [Phycisphaerales bacterium]|nr:DUF1573 domain-containing protein [Phycisphaerales bacterium]
MTPKVDRRRVATPDIKSNASITAVDCRRSRSWRNRILVAAIVSTLGVLIALGWRHSEALTAPAAIGVPTALTADASSAPSRPTLAPRPATPDRAPAQVTEKAPADEALPSPLVAEPDVIDLGLMPPNTTREGSAIVRNPTNETIKIRDVRSSCKCTTTEPYLNHVLPPGATIPVKVVFEGNDVIGQKNQRLFVSAEGYAPLVIPVKAEIVLPIRVTPGWVKFYSEEGQLPTGIITLEALDGRPFQVLSSGGRAPVFADDYKAGDPPRAKYQLRYDVAEYVTPNPADSRMPWWWVVETDHPGAPLLDVRVRSMQTAVAHRKEFWPPGTKEHPRRWTIEPNLRNVVGVFEPGRSKELLVKLEKADGIELISVKPVTTDLIADAAIVGTVEADGEKFYKVRVTPKEDVRGVFQGLILFTASDNLQLGQWVIGTVR